MDLASPQELPCFATRFRLRTRVFGTLLLALAAAGLRLAAPSCGSELPLQAFIALLCNAATWEAWRLRGSKGHGLETIAALLFPWLMLYVLTTLGAAPVDESAAAPAREELPRRYGVSFACWAVVALAVLLREGIRLRGLGMPLIQQAVARGVLVFLYPVGFLTVGMEAAPALCALIGSYLSYRLFKAAVHNPYAALALTLAAELGLEYGCMQLGAAPDGLLLALPAFGGAQSTFYGGAFILCGALLLPCVKLIQYFRSKLGGGASPLPLLGFLGDILALPALPYALQALLLLASYMLLGAGAALPF